MSDTNINWFPGHMAKAMRQIREKLNLIDVVIEVLDSRAPFSSINNSLKELINEYPNDYEDRVSIEVSSIDVNPSIQINFDGHPCEINYITRFCNLSNFRKEVEKKWSELEGNINEYRIKELQYDLEYHKRNVEEIEKMIKSLQK